MKTRTTKEQLLDGDNWGSMIGEKTTTSVGCETTEEGLGGGDFGGVFFSSTKLIPDPHSAPPGVGEGPELIPHVSWV